MAKLVFGLNQSLDGYVDHTAFAPDPVLFRHFIDDVRGLVTKRGARSLFLVDKSIGYHTAGLSAVMHELAPGLYQSRHRHGGEAWLYVVSGKGAAIVNDDRFELREGTLVLIQRGDRHEIRNTGEAPLKTLNVYVPPAYTGAGEALPPGRKEE